MECVGNNYCLLLLICNWVMNKDNNNILKEGMFILSKIIPDMYPASLDVNSLRRTLRHI